MANRSEVDGTVDDEAVERAARALWERDAKRSVGPRLAASDRLWQRVRGEYRRAAEVALTAAAAS